MSGLKSVWGTSRLLIWRLSAAFAAVSALLFPFIPAWLGSQTNIILVPAVMRVCRLLRILSMIGLSQRRF